MKADSRGPELTFVLIRLRAKRYGETSTKLDKRSRGEGGPVFVAIVLTGGVAGWK